MRWSPSAPALLVAATVGALASPPHAGAEGFRPLLWAYGLTRTDDLALYCSLGFNTVYVDVPVETGGTDPRVREFVAAAKSRGLSVIIGLPMALGRDPTDLRDPVSPLNDGYLDDLDRFVYSVVGTYGGDPAVVGWGLQHGPAYAITYSDRDLRAYLRRMYSSVAQLNAAWGKRLRDFDSARLESARGDVEQPFGVGRASLDIADYKRAAFEDLHRAWARTVRKFDDSRPIFSGRQTRPRNLVSLPDEVDYVVPDLQAMTSASGGQGLRLEAISIARRAGRFEVVPALPVPPSEGFEPRARARRARTLSSWIRLCAAHGARGVAFASWPRLRRAISAEPELAARLGGGTPLTDALRSELARNPFDLHPRASAAILYEPYAKGVSTRDSAEPGVRRREANLYGFMDKGGAEFDPLFSAFGGGTAFGGVDVLTVEDVTHVDLDQYGVILAPQAFSAPPEALAALDEYVMRGGALVADFGFGVRQTGSWLAMPDRAAALFGIRKFIGISNTYGAWRAQDARITSAVPGFPSLAQGLQTAGDAPRHSAPGAGPTSAGTAAFSGFHATAALSPRTLVLAIIATAYDESIGQGFSGVFVNPRGMGIAVYATVLLWEHWPPTDPVYRAFHADLLARRPAVVLHGARDLFARGLAVGATEEGVWALNKGRAAVLARVFVPGARGRAYVGAVAEASAALKNPEGTRAGAELVSFPIAPGELVLVRSAPLRAEPLARTCAILLTTYSPDEVRFVIGGPNARARRSRDGGVRIQAGLTGDVRVTLEDGEYRVEPGSRHVISIRHPTGRTPPKTLRITADAKARLRFTESFSHHVVTITPAADSARAAAQE